MDEPASWEPFREALVRSGVGAGERVAVLSAGTDWQERGDAYAKVARALGAIVERVSLDAEGDARARLADFGRGPLEAHPDIVSRLARPGLVVDLLVASFTPACDALLAGGARVLLATELPEVMRRMPCSEAHVRRTAASFERLAGAASARVTSRAGTDVTYRFGGRYRPLYQVGEVREPGRWDAFPSGLVARCTDDVDGVVVLDTGDILCHANRHVKDPVRLEIHGGRVTSIAGAREAERLRATIEAYGDPRAYAVSHIGWGTHAGARWFAGSMGMDARSFAGSVLFSLGPNREFGGDNDTPCHLDLPLRSCSVWLDGAPILDAGRWVDPELAVCFEARVPSG